MKKLSVGIIGCGNISSIYLQNLQRFEGLEVAAVADAEMPRASVRAREFGIAQVLTVDEMLRSDVDIIVNLTPPQAHAEVARKVLESGKHVYGEKPLAINLEDGRGLLALAREGGRRIGSAPDTVLGGGIQTCRKLIDDGWIGQPVAATAFMLCHGHEGWHPDPEFYYKVGGGPMFDMGPYYLSALVTLLGPVRRIAGSASVSFAERTITSQPKYGNTIQVETPTHVAGVFDFAGGAVATVVTSFDVWHAEVPRIEIYGSEGTLSVPDPNTFGGPVRVRRHGAPEWNEISLTHGFTDNWRGLGVADMAAAIREDREARANGDIALHVLELMNGVHVSSQENRHYMVESTCDRPIAMPMDGQPLRW